MIFLILNIDVDQDHVLEVVLRIDVAEVVRQRKDRADPDQGLMKEAKDHIEMINIITKKIKLKKMSIFLVIIIVISN